jgi:hypothetical protein
MHQATDIFRRRGPAPAGGRCFLYSALLSLLAAVVVPSAVTVTAVPAGAATSHYLFLDGANRTGSPKVGCADVVWAASAGKIDPVEVRWLAESGLRCPDNTVDREGVPSEQYVVMSALAQRGELTCEDVRWNTDYGYLTWSAAISLAGSVPDCTLSRYQLMVALAAGQRLSCGDIRWNLSQGIVRRIEAYWLAGATHCDWALIEPLPDPDLDDLPVWQMGVTRSEREVAYLPDSAAIVTGTIFGGGGGWRAKIPCQPGFARVDILAWDGGSFSDRPGLRVWADDFLVVIATAGKAMPGNVDFKAGSAAFGPVNSSIFLDDTRPPGRYRIRYDCRN